MKQLWHRLKTTKREKFEVPNLKESVIRRKIDLRYVALRCSHYKLPSQEVPYKKYVLGHLGDSCQSTISWVNLMFASCQVSLFRSHQLNFVAIVKYRQRAAHYLKIVGRNFKNVLFQKPKRIKIRLTLQNLNFFCRELTQIFDQSRKNKAA